MAVGPLCASLPASAGCFCGRGSLGLTSGLCIAESCVPCAQLGHIDFDHDRAAKPILECACKKYRPDFWAELPTFVLVVEVDEHQHEIYEPSCELRRLVELLAACMGKPLVVIRYNPDAYKIQGETERTSTKKRQAALIETIRKYEDQILDKILTVEYLFYSDFRKSELETELATQLHAYISAGE